MKKKKRLSVARVNMVRREGGKEGGKEGGRKEGGRE